MSTPAPGEVRFNNAKFSGGTVDFAFAEFSGGTVDFSYPGEWSVPPEFSLTDMSRPGVKLPKKENQSEA